MSLQRRSLLTAAFGGALSAALAPAARASVPAAAPAAAAPAFVKPTAEHPILANYNENPLGLAASARKAVADSLDVANRYPDDINEELRKACAEMMGGKPDQIVLTQGSAEAIRCSIEALAKPGATLVTAELTYSDGEMIAERNGMPVVKAKMGPKWSMDIPAMKKLAEAAAAKGSAVVYFVNPNNPTSTIADTEALFAWIRSKPANTTFIVDEAYAEFVEDKSYRSCSELIAEGLDNVTVLKTFSKIFAMAGMRLGFAYALEPFAAKIRDHIAYDSFQNTPACAAALAEIADKAYLAQSRGETIESRRIMEEVLGELGLECLPSQTNFVFFNLNRPLKPFAQAMKAEHIVVGRPFPPADTWCRISYVRPAEMRYVADVMRGMRAKGLI